MLASSMHESVKVKYVSLRMLEMRCAPGLVWSFIVKIFSVSPGGVLGARGTCTGLVLLCYYSVLVFWRISAQFDTSVFPQRRTVYNCAQAIKPYVYLQDHALNWFADVYVRFRWASSCLCERSPIGGWLCESRSIWRIVIRVFTFHPPVREWPCEIFVLSVVSWSLLWKSWV